MDFCPFSICSEFNYKAKQFWNWTKLITEKTNKQQQQKKTIFIYYSNMIFVFSTHDCERQYHTEMLKNNQQTKHTHTHTHTN